MLRLTSAVVLTVAALAAQQKPTTARYLPNDHKNVVFADLAALRARGVWDELEVSVLKAVFVQMQKEMGCPLAAIDRVVMAAESPTGTGMSVEVRQVLVLEGNAPLDKPPTITVGRWAVETIGEQEVHTRGGDDGEMFFQPKPEARVWGTTAVLRPVLEGTPNAGLPAADVLSLLSGRGDNLAYLCLDVDNPLLRENVLGRLFAGVTWPEGEAPTFLFARVRATGEADDPHLEVEAVLRHSKAGEGMAVTEGAVEAWLQAMRKEPQWRPLKPVLEKIDRRRDRTDVVLRADLGRARNAVGHLALLVQPILTPQRVEVEVVEEVPAPPPEPKKPEPKKLDR